MMVVTKLLLFKGTAMSIIVQQILPAVVKVLCSYIMFIQLPGCRFARVKLLYLYVHQVCRHQAKPSFNHLPHMPILGSFNSAANKDVMS